MQDDGGRRRAFVEALHPDNPSWSDRTSSPGAGVDSRNTRSLARRRRRPGDGRRPNLTGRPAAGRRPGRATVAYPSSGHASWAPRDSELDVLASPDRRPRGVCAGSCRRAEARLQLSPAGLSALCSRFFINAAVTRGHTPLASWCRPSISSGHPCRPGPGPLRIAPSVVGFLIGQCFGLEQSTPPTYGRCEEEMVSQPACDPGLPLFRIQSRRWPRLHPGAAAARRSSSR